VQGVGKHQDVCLYWLYLYSAGYSIAEEFNIYETPYRVEVALANVRRVGAKLFLAEAGAKGRRGSSLWLNLIPGIHPRHLCP